MRSPSQMDIVQVDITTRCHLACSNCTRLIAHQPRREDMTIKAFEAAVMSMDGWNQPNRVLGIIGGEPTLHADFETIALTFADMWGGPKTEHGRHPIPDMNVFAEARLYDRSNGRGLWTSLGAGFYRNMEVIMDVFSHWNTNTHEVGGRHQALLVTREDYQEATGMSDEEWLRNRDACWVQNLWSATINDKGAYPCEVMASIDRLLFNGKHAWPVEKGWWERKPEDFGDMLDLCNYCSLAQPGPSQVDALERDIVSPQMVDLLREAGSPAVRRENYDLYGLDLLEEQRKVETKDSYVSGARVSQEHASTLPRKISAIVTCVGRAEHLRESLPTLLASGVDEVVVVSTREDSATQEVLRSLRRFNQIVANKITLVNSTRAHAGHAAFNKGALINDALRSIMSPDWILLTDADIKFPERVFEARGTINPGVLYGAFRNRGNDSHDEEPNGYFQLFNRRAMAIRDRWPEVMSEEFCSAGSIDSWFLQQWPSEKTALLPIVVNHIEHDRLSWNAPAKGPHWSQIGVFAARGFIPIVDFIPPGKTRLKLTDTRHGESVEFEMIAPGSIPEDIVRAEDGVVYFRGQGIGFHHVHIARWVDNERQDQGLSGSSPSQAEGSPVHPDPEATGQ